VIPSLARLVEELAADLPDVEATADPGAGAPESRSAADGRVSRAWSFRKTPFAMLGPSGIELRLDAPIAAAATRTPDTGPSPRGPEWIRFNPRELDGHAVDRLTAWFDLAYRRAGG
jgi:hypothetical protein